MSCRLHCLRRQRTGAASEFNVSPDGFPSVPTPGGFDDQAFFPYLLPTANISKRSQCVNFSDNFKQHPFHLAFFFLPLP
jgi:hypothetical protein